MNLMQMGPKIDIDKKAIYRNAKAQSPLSKTTYIFGFIDAFNRASTIKEDKQLSFPYDNKRYFDAIDSFCKKPENNDKKISEVVLIINDEMKKAKE